MPTPERWLIYGATGFTGRILARRARALGLAPLLAGRDAARLRRLAGPLGLTYHDVRLNDPVALARVLRGVKVVLNAAGPFVDTAGPLVAACLATGTHYVDVSGELSVFAALERRGEEACQQGVMLLPGAGFVIVATDCLAAHVAGRLPGAVRLRLGISLPVDLAGRGSLRTAAPHLGSGVHIRRGGRLSLLPWTRLEHDFDFGRGRRRSLAVTWADAITAHHTTSIPNIEIYLDLPPAERAALLAGRLFAGWLRSSLGRALLRAKIESWRAGATPAERQRARCAVVAEADDEVGRSVSSRLHSPDQYTFTAAAALAIVSKVLAGEISAGFQTPARVYGADFVLGLGGVVREDLPDGRAGQGLQAVASR